MSQIVTIYDDNGMSSLCEVEDNGTRVIRVLSTPIYNELESDASKHADSGWMNDFRFGTEGN